jgi:ACS family tartrate transporter-like MFS transporter
MMFVRTPASFYTLRFLLGVAEAGFFPGMILYLTYWFPAAERARALALFMTSTAMAGVIGGPLSGALLTLDGRGGLAGWQWLFLVEGLPAVLLGFVVLRYLPDGPHEAAWLAPAERAWIEQRLAAERAEKEARRHYTLREALTDRRVLLLGLTYFGVTMGLYGIGFWLPQILQAVSLRGSVAIGLVSALPYLVAAVAMVAIARHSDRTGERRWHVALSAFVGAAGLAASALAQSPVLLVAAICVAAVGIWGALGTFWTLPTAVLSGTAAAGGIALINSIGNLGGFAGPYLVGLVRGDSPGFLGALALLAGFLVLTGVLALLVERPGVARVPAPVGAD